MRKIHNTHGEGDNVPPPDKHPKIMAPYVTGQLQKDELIEIWYFTNAALTAASNQSLQVRTMKALSLYLTPLLAH